jgi:hypothetical protein
MQTGNITTYVEDFRNLQFNGSGNIRINIPTYSIQVWGAPNSGINANVIATKISEAFKVVSDQYTANPPPALRANVLDYNMQFLEDWTTAFNDANKQSSNSNSKNEFGVSISPAAYPTSTENELVSKSSTCQ